MDGLIDFRIKPPVRDTAADSDVSVSGSLEQYEVLYGMADRVNTPFDELVAEMETHNVRGIMQAEFEESGNTRWWNERVADLVGRRPDLFLGGIAGIDPSEPAAREILAWAHDELGLRGMVIQPGFVRMYPNDQRCYALYAYCQERGVPVTMHTGVNFTKYGSIDFGRPVWADHVACDFPDLTIVLNHGGWPWVTEALAVAWKHRNVYLEFGAIAPKYIADPAGGWQPLPHWMRTNVREQVLLGTDWPMLRYDRLVKELPLLELGDAEALYVRENALGLINRVWPRVES